MIGLEQPMIAAASTVQRYPVHRAFREGELLCGIAHEADARHHGMLQLRAERRSCLVEIAAWVFLLEWRWAHAYAIDFDAGACWVAGDAQFIGERERWTRQQEEKGTDLELRAGSHEQTSPEDEPRLLSSYSYYTREVPQDFRHPRSGF